MSVNNSLSFLDIPNLEGFLPISYKYNLVATLLHRGFMI